MPLGTFRSDFVFVLDVVGEFARVGSQRSSKWPRSEAVGWWSWSFTGAIPCDLPRSHPKRPTRALGTSFGHGELRAGGRNLSALDARKVVSFLFKRFLA